VRPELVAEVKYPTWTGDIPERVGVAGGMSLHILTVWLVASATLQLELEHG